MLTGLLILLLIIFFHELGHWMVARWWKFSTPVLSLGFGPKLFKLKWNNTEWRLCLIPLGGYTEFHRFRLRFKKSFRMASRRGSGLARTNERKRRMITGLLCGIVVGILGYALILRFVWRRLEERATISERILFLDQSARALKASELRAPELAKSLEGVSLKPLGLVGEALANPGFILCPITTLFSLHQKGVAIAWCGISAAESSLCLIGDQEIPTLLISAFESDCLLMTIVGQGDTFSEEDLAKQYAPDLREAWHLHEATILAWEGEGHPAKRSGEAIWSVAENRLAAILHPAPTVFEREHYYQKFAFIALGGAACFCLGVLLALWL